MNMQVGQEEVRLARLEPFQESLVTVHNRVPFRLSPRPRDYRTELIQWSLHVVNDFLSGHIRVQ